MRGVGAPRCRMPRHLLFAISLLLLLLCRACGPAYAGDDAPEDSVTLFKACDRDIHEELCDEMSPRVVSAFASSFLVGGNGVMVAFAEAQYTENGEDTVDIVARYIETEKEDWVSKAIKKNESGWKTQLVLRGKEGMNPSALSNPTAVIKGNKIYLLALNNRTNDSFQNGNGLYFELTVGAITGEVGSKKIEWKASESLHFKLMQEVNRRNLSVFSDHDNSAFLRSDKRILFGASATNKEGKRGFAILQLKDDEEQWKVSFVEDPGECRVFSLFEWKEKLISFFFRCLTGTRYVKEYDEVNEEWKDAEDRLLYMWSSPYALRGFTPVTIGNKTALLFIDEKRSGGATEIPLWYTDGSWMGDAVWPIGIPYEDYTYRGLLYTNDELFFMYQDISEGSGAIVLTHLNLQLNEIRTVLVAWDENDAYLSKPCDETAPEAAFPDTLCVTPMPTDGLVGFLSDGGDFNQWFDNYRFRDAVVRSEVKVKNGYEFRGADEGAQWPLGEMYPRKGYNFTKYGLTVVATVTIHETPKDNAPLLTVDGDGVNERFGLWYKNKQWKVVSNNNEELATDLETQKEYRVALMLQNDTISVYVNGKSRGSPLPISAPGEKPFDLENIFIGGYGGGSGIYMTVTDVLLYSRVLKDIELEAISKTIPPATSTYLEKTTKAQTDSEEMSWRHRYFEDGSVCVHTSFTLLFLMSGFCLAIFSVGI